MMKHLITKCRLAHVQPAIDWFLPPNTWVAAPQLQTNLLQR